MLPFRNIKRFIQKAMKQPFYALGVAGKRLSAHYSYYFKDGKSSSPEAVTFFLTRGCNLRCKMCGQWGEHGVTKQKDVKQLREWFSLEDVRSVVKELKKYNTSVTLFGGEPFLHPNILEIIETVKKESLHCLVITNGTLLERFAKEIVELRLDELNVSIDRGRDLHDTIRGIPGVFDTIMSGLEAVNNFKTVGNSKKPLINIQCTINKDNYRKLPELLDVARAVKANSLTFHNLIFLGPKAIEEQKAVDIKLNCSSKDWEGFVFEPGIDPKELYEVLQGVLNSKNGFSVDYYPNFSKKGMEEYYLKADYLPSEYASRCLSPWICCYVFPEGEVRPCLNCSYSFGNVKKTGFMKIWNSEEANFYRKMLKKDGIFPACRRCTELYRY